MDKVTRYGAEMAEMKEGKDAMTKVAKYEVERNRVADALEAIAETNARVLELYERVCLEHTRFAEINERYMEIRERELEIREEEFSRDKTRDLLRAKLRLQQVDLAITETRSAVSEVKEKLKITIDRWDIDRLQPAVHIDEFRLEQLDLERNHILETYPELAIYTSTND